MYYKKIKRNSLNLISDFEFCGEAFRKQFFQSHTSTKNNECIFCIVMTIKISFSKCLTAKLEIINWIQCISSLCNGGISNKIWRYYDYVVFFPNRLANFFSNRLT